MRLYADFRISFLAFLVIFAFFSRYQIGLLKLKVASFTSNRSEVC